MIFKKIELKNIVIKWLSDYVIVWTLYELIIITK
jgi:hypothetical protein